MRQSFEKLLRPVRLKATMEEAYGEVNARRATAAIQLWRRRAVPCSVGGGSRFYCPIAECFKERAGQNYLPVGRGKSAILAYTLSCTVARTVCMIGVHVYTAYSLFDLYSVLGQCTNLEGWLTRSEAQELGTR